MVVVGGCKPPIPLAAPKPGQGAIPQGSVNHPLQLPCSSEPEGPAEALSEAGSTSTLPAGAVPVPLVQGAKPPGIVVFQTLPRQGAPANLLDCGVHTGISTRSVALPPSAAWPLRRGPVTRTPDNWMRPASPASPRVGEGAQLHALPSLQRDAVMWEAAAVCRERNGDLWAARDALAQRIAQRGLGAPSLTGPTIRGPGGPQGWAPPRWRHTPSPTRPCWQGSQQQG